MVQNHLIVAHVDVFCYDGQLPVWTTGTLVIADTKPCKRSLHKVPLPYQLQRFQAVRLKKGY